VKRPWLAAILSLLLCTMVGATCDPFVQLVARTYYVEHFKRVHLRFRRIDHCRFEVLDDLPAKPGDVWLWQGGTSRGLYETGFPDTVRYDAGSRVLEDLDCDPDGGRPRPPYDVTFEIHAPPEHLPPIDEGPFKPFLY